MDWQKLRDLVVSTLPKAELFQKGTRFTLLKHPECSEILTGLERNVLASMLVRIDKSWIKINTLASENSCLVLTPREDFFGRETMLRYSCRDCGGIWENRYEIQKNALRKWKAKPNMTGKNKFCKHCRKSMMKSRTQCETYRKMPDATLYQTGLGVPEEFKQLSSAFTSRYSVLANELKRRKDPTFGTLFNKLAKKCGWISQRPELKAWGCDDWERFLESKRYLSISHWKFDDPHSLFICSRRHKKIYRHLKAKFFTRRAFKFEGHLLDSLAEVAVAEALSMLDIPYNVHQPWGFSKVGGKRSMKKDFCFEVNQAAYDIEVWMVGQQFLTATEKNDQFLLDYIAKRHYKMRQAATLYPERQLISIEARLLVQGGIESFVDHIKSQLVSAGISEAAQLEAKSFRLKPRTDPNLWEMDDFFEYCVNNGCKYFSHMPQSFRQALDLRPDVKRGLMRQLAHHFQYPCNTRHELADFDAVLAFVKGKPELQYKTGYQKAHKRGELPPGFPQNILAAYPEVTSWFQLRSREAPVFVDYEAAKLIVQKYKFGSKSEFLKARAQAQKIGAPEDLLSVYACPGNPVTGGYKEFESWPKFLGYKPPKKLTSRELNLLENGNAAEVLRFLKPIDFDLATKAELRKIITAAGMRAFEKNPNKIDIEISLFGKTCSPVTDLIKIAREVPLDVLRTEKAWLEARRTVPYYRRYASKLYRYLPQPSTSWNEVKDYLQGLRSST